MHGIFFELLFTGCCLYLDSSSTATSNEYPARSEYCSNLLWKLLFYCKSI